MLLVAIASLGCTWAAASSAPSVNTAAASDVPSPSPRSSKTPGPSASPSPEPLPSGLPESVVRSIEQRRAYGLRSDLEWVLDVADDPSADRAFGFPMLPQEEAQIWDRQAMLTGHSDRISGHIESARDEFGGLFLDQANARIVTLWTRNVDDHLAAMLEAAGQAAPIEARQVRWTERELQSVADYAGHHFAFFAQLDAEPMGFGSDIGDNVVDIEISSANPDATRLIAEEYARRLGVPVEMFRITSDGTGVELMPLGTVRALVVKSNGDMPGPNELLYRTIPDEAGKCAALTWADPVPNDGELGLSCTVGHWRIRLFAPGPDAPDHIDVYSLFPEELMVVGSTEFTVQADETVRLDIRLEPGAQIRR
jgi:hypothetical protein